MDVDVAWMQKRIFPHPPPVEWKICRVETSLGWQMNFIEKLKDFIKDYKNLLGGRMRIARQGIKLLRYGKSDAAFVA